MKTTLAVLVAAVALLALFLLRSDPEGPSDVDRVPADASTGAPDESLGRGASTSASRTAIDDSASADDAPTPFAVPVVRVLDASGAPIPNVRGAWVDDRRDVHELEFDAQGRATRPSPLHGVVAVGAAGHLGQTFYAGAETAGSRDIVVTLRPEYEITGVVRVDGDPPGHPLRFDRLVAHTQYGLNFREQDVVPRLVEIVLPAYSTPVDVNADGTFVATVEWEMDLVPLHVPAGYQARTVVGAAADYGADWAIGDPEHRSLEIDLARVPSVVGRIEWEDGEPIAGETVRLWAKSGSRERPMMRDGTTEPDGSFAVSITERRTAPTGSFEDRVAALDLEEVWVSVSGPNIGHQNLEKIDLSDATYPVDAGVLHVRRPPTVDVEVLARVDGREVPIQAVVTSPVAGEWTNEEGRVTIGYRRGEPIDVHANGCKPFRGSPPDEGEPMRIVLDPAPALIVDVDQELDMLRVRLTYDEHPFHLPQDGDAPPSLSTTAYAMFASPASLAWPGKTKDGQAPSELLFGAHRTEPLVVPALREGATLTVELLDPLGGVFAERKVTMPASTTTVRFDAAEIESASLELDLRWSDGTPVETGRVRVRGRGENPTAWFAHLDMETPRLAPITLGDVDVTTEVPGAKNVQLRAVPIAPGAPPLAIVLERE